MNFFKGKFFYFFVPENKFLIKFKPANEKFFSANTIFKPTILSALMYSINADDTIFSAIKTEKPDFPIKLKNFKKLFYTFENINFIIENSLLAEAKINFIVLDQSLNIRFVYDNVLYPEEREKIVDFYLTSPGKYKMIFYYNNQYVFFTKFRVLNKYVKDAVKYNIKNKKIFYLKLDNYRDILEYSIINKYTGIEYFQMTTEDIRVKKQELYIPINNVISDISDDNFFRYLKVNDNTKYNASGMYKVVQSIRLMKPKEQVEFIESLFKTERNLAQMILENVFNFYLLYIIPDNEKREILKLIDLETLWYAIKAEPQEKQSYIKKYLNKKRKTELEKKFKDIKLVSADTIKSAQQSIGNVIRAYYQSKFGVPFIMEEFFEFRLKQQIFNNKLVFTDKYKVTIPDFYFSGHFSIRLKTVNQVFYELPINAVSGRKSFQFADYWIYETKRFVEIFNIDNEYVYLKFLENNQKTQIVIRTENNALELKEYNFIHTDEIIPVPYYSNRTIEFFIGTLYNSGKFNEAHLIVDIFDEVKKYKEVFHLEEENEKPDIKEWLLTYKKYFKDKLDVLYKLSEQDLYTLFLEYKIYKFLYEELNDEFYKNLSDLIYTGIKHKYVDNGLFRSTPEKEGNIEDTVDILYYIDDLKKDENFKDIIEKMLKILKKRKIKIKRLRHHRDGG